MPPFRALLVLLGATASLVHSAPAPPRASASVPANLAAVAPAGNISSVTITSSSDHPALLAGPDTLPAFLVNLVSLLSKVFSGTDDQTSGAEAANETAGSAPTTIVTIFVTPSPLSTPRPTAILHRPSIAPIVPSAGWNATTTTFHTVPTAAVATSVVPVAKLNSTATGQTVKIVQGASQKNTDADEAVVWAFKPGQATEEMCTDCIMVW